MKSKSKPTTRAARFAAAEKALKAIVKRERSGMLADLETFGVATEPAPLPRDGFIRWQPEDLHEMGLLR